MDLKIVDLCSFPAKGGEAVSIYFIDGLISASQRRNRLIINSNVYCLRKDGNKDSLPLPLAVGFIACGLDFWRSILLCWKLLAYV